MDKFECDLPAVGVAREAQIDPQFGGAVEGVGIVGQQNIDRARQH